MIFSVRQSYKILPLAAAAALLAAIAGGIAGGCGKEQSASATATPASPPANVSVTSAISQDVPVYLDQIGKTAAFESVTIQPQVTGKVMALHFTDGANVTKGELLFSIDSRPFQAVLAQAEATLAQNEADVKWAQGELQRFTEVQGTGAVSKNELEQKTNALAVAQAKVQAAMAEIEQAKLNVEYCEIKSPIDGRAGQRLVDPGNVVSNSGPNGGTQMLTIQRLDPIYADFTVTENQLGTVRKFMARGVLPEGDPQGKLTALVDTPGNAQDVIDALGALPTSAATQPAGASSQPAGALTAATRPATRVGAREGVLTFLDNTVQNATGTVKVRATLANADHYFWPGQFVQVRLVLTIKKNAVLVPAAAAQVAQVGSYVYVVKPDSTAEMRPVQLGQRQHDMVVIEKGLAAGESVITAGHMLVQPGGKVHVMETPAAPGGAPASGAVAQADPKNTDEGATGR